jgi:hypothetical protein
VDTGLYSGGYFRVYVNGNTSTQSLTLDTSGNLGLGVTPSAWNSGFKALQVSNSVLYNNGDADTFLGSNFFTDSGGTNKYISTSAAGAYGQVDGSHRWFNAASGTAGNTVTFTQAMTLDASGNLGIGTTSPEASYRLDIRATTAAAKIQSTTGTNIAFLTFANIADMYVGREGSAGGVLATGTSAYSGVISVQGAYPLAFATANAERMRIDSSGNLLVGTTSALNGTARLEISAPTGNNRVATFKNDAGANQWNTQIWNAGTSGDNAFVQFATETSYTGRGSISYNRGAGLVAYNTTSDYRAKDIISPVLNSGEVIDSVPVYMGKMKDATQARPMFIAHETPDYAHTGEKDAVDEDGNPVYQQMDASSLVPVLWAEIQSLRKRVALLESK